MRNVHQWWHTVINRLRKRYSCWRKPRDSEQPMSAETEAKTDKKEKTEERGEAGKAGEEARLSQTHKRRQQWMGVGVLMAGGVLMIVLHSLSHTGEKREQSAQHHTDTAIMDGVLSHDFTCSSSDPI